MKESKTTATALVTMTVSVHLTQPWSGEFTLEQVQRTARESAEEKLAGLREEMAKRNISIGQVTAVRIVFNEERP